MALRMRQEQLPLEVMRDLLGVARALYVAWRAQGVSSTRLADLRAVGRDLAEALKLAARTDPGTLGHCAAWDKADRATERLGRLIGSDERTTTLVVAARERLLAGTRRPRR
jgi:hypothetical protein